MAIPPLYFACITKYAAHFVAQSLLFHGSNNSVLKKNARQGPFSQVESHIIMNIVLITFINTLNATSHLSVKELCIP